MKFVEQQQSSQLLFRGRVVSLKVDQVVLPDGAPAEREVVEHSGGAAVLALTADQQVVLVRQYRYACGREMLEIPAGKLEVTDTDPLDCALRELAEETPYSAQHMRLLHSFYPTPGYCSERIYLYLAENVTADSQLQPDEGEWVESCLLNEQQVREALANGQIEDGKTLIALYHWLALLDAARLDAKHA